MAPAACALGSPLGMSQVAPPLREFARRLIACEAASQARPASKIPALNVCERLRPQLAVLMGQAGFRALLLRALALAGAEVPWLRAIQIALDGSVENSPEAAAQVTPAKMAEGGVVLIAQLLGLMVAFIGENLTVRMMSEIWPKLSVKNLDLSKGDKK